MRNKRYANLNIKRNKKPLQNIHYKVELIKSDNITLINRVDQFKDLGYIMLYWRYGKMSMWNMHGIISPDVLKSKLTEKQWKKFCEGERNFIIQRRVDGKNI